VPVEPTFLGMKVARGQTGLMCGLTIVVAAAATLRSAPARAVEEDETVVARTAPPVEPPRLVADEARRLDEGTAYMVGRHTLKLGLLAFEFGITEKLSVGSDPLAWAVRAISTIWVPNLHVKYQFWQNQRVAVAGLVGGYFADVSNGGTSGSVLEFPLKALVSVICTRHLLVHGDVTYVFARAVGSGDVRAATVHGAAAVRALQTGLMVQVPVTRIFSLLAVGRVQLYTGDIGFSGNSQVDPYTNVSLNGTFVPAVQHPWQAVAGAGFLWKHFHLMVGAGYGYYFVPGLEIAVPKQSIVPLASLSVLL
jgi:hypothetical protein